MDTNLSVWKKTLSEIFTHTYSSILSMHELNERIDYIITNINTITPEALYNCLLYSDTRIEVGKLAIDYRMRFCTSDYINVITSGSSYEIDNLIHSEKELIMRDIIGAKILLNMIMFRRLNLSVEPDINKEVLELNKHFKFELHETDNNIWIPSEHILYSMTQNQFCYATVFNQNPFDGLPLNDNVSSSIKSQHKIRCDLFELLKSKNPTGINLLFVTNDNFFG